MCMIQSCLVQSRMIQSCTIKSCLINTTCQYHLTNKVVSYRGDVIRLKRNFAQCGGSSLSFHNDYHTDMVKARLQTPFVHTENPRWTLDKTIIGAVKSGNGIISVGFMSHKSSVPT